MKLAAFIIAFAFCGLLRLSAETPAETEKQVLELERTWAKAFQENDAATIEAIELEDYTLTNSRGLVSSRADDIKEAQNRLVQYEVFQNEDMKVRVYGEAAVVSGRTIVQGMSLGKKVKAVFKFTDMLVRLDGRWRAAAGHVTRMK